MANQIWSVKLLRAKWRHVQITQQPNARKWGQNSFQPYDFTYYMYIKPTFDFSLLGVYRPTRECFTHMER